MNIHSFLEHHGISRNPFAEEDAQTDPVFKEFCISSAYHPVWDKVYGDPSEPSTAIVFGAKGAGKTAIGLQIDRHLDRYNRQHLNNRTFVIRYDDFNPFLDHFQERLPRRLAKKPEKTLDAWRLWDHIDAILCLGVTRLVDRVLDQNNANDSVATEVRDEDLRKLERHQARDLLLLALAYDQSTGESFPERWNGLRKKLGYRNWAVRWDFWLAIAALVVAVVLSGWLAYTDRLSPAFSAALFLLISFAGAAHYKLRWLRCWWMARGIRKHMRVGKRDTHALHKTLLSIPFSELASQPLPRFDRTDDRYELLSKFQSLLARLGFSGVIVLIDRVDEPHLMGGKPELMRRFVWPLLDNKLLKHSGVGLKLLLPQELHRDVERETREFHERARLDKQNLIPSFHWTGEALYDLAQSRLMACAAEGQSPEPRNLFDDNISYERLLAAMQSLRVPRHLFRFLYRVLVEHCNKYTDSDPHYKIDANTFETTLAVYMKDLESTGG
ncbi:hypothetical protein EC9_28420 [Rosistilla ulvae]|uniref:KAP family P-loop domain protein n=1 Tax=Rosistilla ulvae TaxID=1930277 RepID=A0A517M194_9BACT|nr:hypothetical protein [Rosistilla ulvae]QDS88651.1 hypothetical protein EC9_28420 [Rosistilla ulvae]